MPVPRSPAIPINSPSWSSIWPTGEVPNDKDEVLAALSEQEQPTGRAKSAKA